MKKEKNVILLGPGDFIPVNERKRLSHFSSVYPRD